MPSDAGAKSLAKADSSDSVGGNHTPGAGPEGSSEPEAPAKVEKLLVPGDQPISIVRGGGGAPPLTVFVPGVCSNANGYMQAFPTAAKKQGGVIALEGDQPCGNLVGWHTFAWDAVKLNGRIMAAFAASGLTTIPKEGITLVGYSQGAALGEQLAQRWPARYTRLVIIGAPTDPAAAHFSGASAVVTMSCSRDNTARMKDATSRLNHADVPSTYIEMPNCSHGYITEGDRTFGEAFDFLRTNARATKVDAKPEALVGPAT